MNDPSIARQRETRTKVRRCRLEKELCASCRFSPRTDADDAHHPGVHMVEQMAMERPIADCIGGEIEARGAPRLDKHRMLARRAIALPRDQFEKMTVKVNRMAHHRIVRSEETTSELQSLMRNSYAVFCLKKKNRTEE